ncbi:hypothetical protein AMK21_00715 [Streptomyces sp. CB00316]|uniref:hypothetical protein n=1 Tax=unclassified Streptomyces TaxID=2593676 RepID=UPI00093D8D34|nr:MULTISPECIES: hypothetical protein [unclassified Streptomyces]MBT2380383.1 hypothetical protein [Streptomyces sp. ISL-111]OKJ23549.1 hypothetical protein AMK21_00715 [Streptomyces sp. CB00316]
MKTALGAQALIVSIALTTLTGCSMTDAQDSNSLPSAGTSTSEEAARAVKKVSSELYDLIGIKGKASNSGAGVTECGGKDPEKYFQIFHPWSFTPASPEQLGEVMERLKEDLPKNGWKVVEYGPDTSKNKNVRLTADNEKERHSVKIWHYAKRNPPKLSLMVVSGCYQVPEGEKIDRF